MCPSIAGAGASAADAGNWYDVAVWIEEHVADGTRMALDSADPLGRSRITATVESAGCGKVTR